MLRLSAAESSLTVYSGRFARTGGAVWRGVPVIAAYDTRRRGDGEIRAAAAASKVRRSAPPHPPAARVPPSPPHRAERAGVWWGDSRICDSCYRRSEHAGLGDRVGRARARAVLGDRCLAALR